MRHELIKTIETYEKGVQISSIYKGVGQPINFFPSLGDGEK